MTFKAEPTHQPLGDRGPKMDRNFVTGKLIVELILEALKHGTWGEQYPDALRGLARYKDDMALTAERVIDARRGK